MKNRKLHWKMLIHNEVISVQFTRNCGKLQFEKNKHTRKKFLRHHTNVVAGISKIASNIWTKQGKINFCNACLMYGGKCYSFEKKAFLKVVTYSITLNHFNILFVSSLFLMGAVTMHLRLGKFNATKVLFEASSCGQ